VVKLPEERAVENTPVPYAPAALERSTSDFTTQAQDGSEASRSMVFPTPMISPNDENDDGPAPTPPQGCGRIGHLSFADKWETGDAILPDEKRADAKAISPNDKNDHRVHGGVNVGKQGCGGVGDLSFAEKSEMGVAVLPDEKDGGRGKGQEQDRNDEDRASDGHTTDGDPPQVNLLPRKYPLVGEGARWLEEGYQEGLPTPPRFRIPTPLRIRDILHRRFMCRWRLRGDVGMCLRLLVLWRETEKGKERIRRGVSLCRS